MNQLRIVATAVAKTALRYTPAGVALWEASFGYQGSVKQAGGERTLVFEFSVIALGAVAQALDREPLGATMTLEGFIAPRSRRSSRLVMHINEYRIDKDGV